jgi:hypothetical protein
MRIIHLVIVILMMSAAAAGCSNPNCSYYGRPDSNTTCVVVGPGPTGGGH